MMPRVFFCLQAAGLGVVVCSLCIVLEVVRFFLALARTLNMQLTSDRQAVRRSVCSIYVIAISNCGLPRRQVSQNK
jgi:prolipoprotein diacylglyceryltransferase